MGYNFKHVCGGVSVDEEELNPIVENFKGMTWDDLNYAIAGAK